MLRKWIIGCSIALLLFALSACGSDDETAPTDGDNPDGDSPDGDDPDGDDPDGDEPDGDDPDGDEPEFLPAEDPGPYHVGAFSTRFVDAARGRDLTGTVWYPTDQSEGDIMYYQGVIPLGSAIEDAPLTETPGPFPLIVFSHGHQSFDAQSYFLTEYLTTHGFIVAACDHIEDTTGTQDDKYLVKSALDRPQDLSLMIDTLLEWNTTSGHMLEGKIDPARIGATGHSFGAYSVIAVLGPAFDMNDFLDKCEELGEENWTGGWRFCEDMLEDADMSYAEDCTPCSFKDDRILVSVPMCPALQAVFKEGEIEAIDVPMLLMAGELDDTIPAVSEVYPFFEHATHPDTIYWELEGAGHFTFSNMCEILNLPEYGCGTGFTDPDLAYGLINTATTAYLNIFVNQDERYWKYFEDDYLATTPAITIERKSAE